MPNMTRDEIRHFRKLGAEFRRQVNERRMKDDSLELAEILGQQWAREELENADTEAPSSVEPCFLPAIQGDEGRDPFFDSTKR